MSDLTKKEVNQMIKDEFKKFVNNDLDNEVEKIIRKSSSKSRGEVTKTIKDAIEKFAKVLWVKRDFWKSDIK